MNEQKPPGRLTTGIEKIDIFKVFFKEEPIEHGYWHIVAWRDSNDLKEFADRVFDRYSNRVHILLVDPPHTYRGFHTGEQREKVMCRARLFVSTELRQIVNDQMTPQIVEYLSPARRADFPSVFGRLQPWVGKERQA